MIQSGFSEGNETFVEYGVPTAESMKSINVWGVTPCSPVVLKSKLIHCSVCWIRLHSFT
jgi:hypothetical protein